MKYTNHLLGCAVAVVIAVVAVFVFKLPAAVLLVLACPLVMILMMRRMGHEKPRGNSGASNSQMESSEPLVRRHMI